MQPTIVKTSKSDLCLVVVPDDASAIQVSKDGMSIRYSIPSKAVGFREFKRVPLSEEPVWGDYDIDGDHYRKEMRERPKYEIIAPLKDITEEQARELFGCEDSLSALKFCVKSNGLKGNVIILKRIS